MGAAPITVLATAPAIAMTCVNALLGGALTIVASPLVSIIAVARVLVSKAPAFARTAIPGKIVVLQHALSTVTTMEAALTVSASVMTTVLVTRGAVRSAIDPNASKTVVATESAMWTKITLASAVKAGQEMIVAKERPASTSAFTVTAIMAHALGLHANVMRDGDGKIVRLRRVQGRLEVTSAMHKVSVSMAHAAAFPSSKETTAPASVRKTAAVTDTARINDASAAMVSRGTTAPS